MLTIILGYLAALLASDVYGNSLGGNLRRFTPLESEEYPCNAENLKETHRYICDADANVICLSGWREPEDRDLVDLRNPCPIPVCQYENRTCKHGECVRPDTCACKVGWTGHLCEECIRLPGCDHGTCENAFECNCKQDQNGEPLFQGAFCDKPACSDCDTRNGICFEPHVCTCLEGWRGSDCSICEPLPGCVHGGCANNGNGGNNLRPNTCECEEGWEGPLCDRPRCSEGCNAENGFCVEPDTCLCKTGWEGPICDQCVAYWQCPEEGRCIEPNQCICDDKARANDQFGVCNRERINGPRFGKSGECSNHCRKPATEEEIRLVIGEMSEPGTRTTECLWAPDSAECEGIKEECYGTQPWSFTRTGESDPAHCVVKIGSDEETKDEKYFRHASPFGDNLVHGEATKEG